MAVAKIFPESEKGGRGNKNSYLRERFSRKIISYARTVLSYAPDLADNVLNGSVRLNEAYKTALQRKQASEPGKGLVMVSESRNGIGEKGLFNEPFLPSKEERFWKLR